ncbi:MAG: hypothetical protein ACP5RW_09065 [bacterium]
MTLGAARVIWTINDLSMFVDELPNGYTTIIALTERGPLNDPRVISSMEEYRKIFGKKVPYTTDPLTIEMALRNGARLNIIRVAHYDDPSDALTLTAKKASLVLKDRGEFPTSGTIYSREGAFTFRAPFAGSVIGSEVGPFSFVTDSSDKMLLAVGNGDDQEVTLTGTGVTVAGVADQINAATIGITASSYGGKLKLEATDPSNSLSIKNIPHSAYNVLGLQVGTYAAYPGQNKLAVKVDGGQEQVFEFTHGGDLVFSLTASQVASALSGIVGATVTVFFGRVRITSNTTGSASSIQITSNSTAASILGMDTEVHRGTDAGQVDTLAIEALNEGDWGNDITVYVLESKLNPVDRFDLRIDYARQPEMNEYFSDLSMDPKSDRYVVSYVNNRSFLVRVTDLFSPNTRNGVNRPALSITSPCYVGWNLSGGDYGLYSKDTGEMLFDDMSDWIGDPVLQTGIYAADKAYMSMDLMIPGTTNEVVYNALISYCENRQDMIAYGQVPFGLLPEDAVKWRMGEAPTYSHPPFNSHRFALFFGHPVVYDDMDDTLKTIPCLGHLAACLCKTDSEYGYHFAPSGPRRGRVNLVEDIDFNINAYRSTGYADLFAEKGINYLMISRIPGAEGAMFWEQRTTQTLPSATRDLNVMRFLTMAYRMLVPILRNFVFEPNHPMTWREIHRVLEPALQDFKDKYRIYDFALQTDKDAFFDNGVLKNAVINTGLDIDRGIYKCRVLVQPTRTIYYLEFEVGVTRTGEAFSTYTSLKELPGIIRR